jgi:hypothetical protein
VLTRYGVTVLYRVMGATETSRTDFTLNAKVSRLTLTGPSASNLFGQHVRETSAFIGSELLPLATEPARLPVQGDRIASPVPRRPWRRPDRRRPRPAAADPGGRGRAHPDGHPDGSERRPTCTPATSSR